MGDKVFADGLIVKRNDRAPDFVICNLSVKVAELVAFLQEHESEGWVNIQVNRSKGGKLYAQLDDFRPTQGDHAKQGIADARGAMEPHPDRNVGNPGVGAGGITDFDDDIPF